MCSRTSPVAPPHTTLGQQCSAVHYRPQSLRAEGITEHFSANDHRLKMLEPANTYIGEAALVITDASMKGLRTGMTQCRSQCARHFFNLAPTPKQTDCQKAIKRVCEPAISPLLTIREGPASCTGTTPSAPTAVYDIQLASTWAYWWAPAPA